jgi:hypothetical protein
MLTYKDIRVEDTYKLRQGSINNIKRSTSHLTCSIHTTSIVLLIWLENILRLSIEPYPSHESYLNYFRPYHSELLNSSSNWRLIEVEICYS